MREVKTDTVNFSLNLADCSPAVTNVVMQTLQNTFDSLRKVIETDKEEQKKKETKNHWKPITSEKYFFTYSNGDVDSVIWTENKADKGRYGLRNVFRTKEEAEFEVERRKIMTELQNYADEHNGEIAHPSDAFWLGFDEDNMLIIVEDDSIFRQLVLYCFLMQTQLTMQLKTSVKTELLNICLELIQIKNFTVMVIANAVMNIIHGTMMRRKNDNEKSSKI